MIFLYILLGVLTLLLIYIFFLFICSILVDPRKEYERNSRFYRFLLNSASLAVLKLMRVKVHISGIEKIPKDVLPLFVGNHRSNFDPIIEWCVFGKWQPAFVSKASNFKIPIFGRLIRKCCFMAIDRENPRKALVTINKAAKLLQKGEVSIGIYPEGTRSKSGKLLPFHNGVFKIAQKANAPIVVVTISGTEKIHKNYPFHHTDVYLDVVEVIPAERVRESRTDIIGGHIRNEMEQQLNGDENASACY